MPESFAPIVGESPRVLLLGTMPGRRSLEAGEYYAHPQNAFWRILSRLFGAPAEDYAAKLRLLTDHGIALWDVLRHCDREGSSDSAIRNPAPNDFAALFRAHPGIHSVCFNGKAALTLYRRHVEPSLSGPEHRHRVLPSTSPAHTLPFEEKYRAWQVLREMVEERL